MSALGHRLFAAVYDTMMAPSEQGALGELRDEVIGHARGDVLEIGAGTGLNLRRYEGVDRLVLSEPIAPMRRRLAGRLGDARVPVEVVDAPAEDLPFADASFDTVVSTLVLCSVADPVAALAEVRRVLRPGGRFVFLEHGAGEGSRAVWQHRLDRPWAAVSAGCHLTRDVAALLPAARLTIEELRVLEPHPTPAIVLPFRLGVAVAA